MAEVHLFKELKRRNVLRAAVLYIGAVWALAQGIAQLGPAVGAPDWTIRWFLVAVIIGFPFWIAFAWFYEFTPTGLKRESAVDRADSIAHSTGRKLDFWIIGVMAVAIVLLLTNQFVLHHGANEVTVITAPPYSVAVLPFANMSSDKDQDYFADGISEDLLNLLAKVQPLQVAAHTSSFAFKGNDLGIAEIAAKLHVANVLEGSVRKAGDEVRITARLVRAADGYEIWSQSYDRKLTDIFAIQDGIAADVVKNLRVKLLGALPTARATDPRAYALYLQARQLTGQKTADAFRQSEALYRRALAIDPRYAPAWVGLGYNFVTETSIGLLPNDEGLRRAREAAETALAIDPDCAPAHAELGYLAMIQNDLAGAARHFHRALALDASDPGVLRNSATLLDSLGRLKAAIAVEEYAVARDPINVGSLANLGNDYLYAGRFDDAIAKFRTVLTLSPEFGGGEYALGEALLFKGDAPAALVQMQQEKDEGWRLIGLPMVYHALGEKARSDAALTTLIAKYVKDAPYNIAAVHAYRGDADQAFAWLDKAVQYADPGLSQISVDNLFDPVRADPRWLPFLRKIGYAPEQLAKIPFTVTLPERATTIDDSAAFAAAPAAGAATDQP